MTDPTNVFAMDDIKFMTDSTSSGRGIRIGIGDAITRSRRPASNHEELAT